MKKKENIIWGIILIIIGVIFGLNAMGITDINIFFKGWWTLFIIIPAIVDIIKEPTKTGNYIWLAIGVLLLLNAQGIIKLSNISKLIFPAILIIIGAGIIFKEQVGTKVNEKIKELNENTDKEKLEEYYATFSGQTINLKGEIFKGANVNAIFGGLDLNITEAEINKDTLINATAVFGGIDIKVPSNVNVQVKSTGIFGGTDNKIKKVTENMPTIYIKSFCLFGGVDIK